MLPFLIGGAALLLLWAASTDKGQETVKDLLSPAQFVLKYYRDAVLSQFDTGVPALSTLAQGGKESNWGKSAPGFNFFGIKAGKSWKGETQELKTWECGTTGDPVKDGITDKIIAIYPPGSSQGICGLPNSDFQEWLTYQDKYKLPGQVMISGMGKGEFYSYRVYSKFRKYPSAKDSFIDHGRFLRDNPRYKKAFLTSTPEAFITEVHRAGYATDPLYSSALIKLIGAIREVLTRAGLI